MGSSVQCVEEHLAGDLAVGLSVGSFVQRSSSIGSPSGTPMAQLIYSTIASLDGYVEDKTGNFGWATPDDEVFSFIAELERPIGTYLYGRRMYETMLFWESAHLAPDQSPVERDFTEIWQAAGKVVYSRGLGSVSSANTRVERDFDANAVRHLKATSGQDMTVAGPNLAAQALSAGLVDELQLFVVPVVVGGGKPWLPDGERIALELIDVRRFASGVVYLRYCPAS
jgi:dihydrofolate reductase